MGLDQRPGHLSEYHCTFNAQMDLSAFRELLTLQQGVVVVMSRNTLSVSQRVLFTFLKPKISCGSVTISNYHALVQRVTR